MISCLKKRNYQSERCIDESVESKNCTESLIVYQFNSVFDLLRFHQSGVQHYLEHSSNMSGTRAEKNWT